MAETPAPTLIGAERVVIACEFKGDLGEAERRGLCEQLVRKAQRFTELPVTVATAADLSLGPNLRQLSNQLLLRIEGDARNSGNGQKTMRLEITPVRLARAVGNLAPVQSSVSLVQVQGDWMLQGPIQGFEKLLGGGRGGKLRAPIHSDI